MVVYGYCRVSTACEASEGKRACRHGSRHAFLDRRIGERKPVHVGVTLDLVVHERPKGGPLFAKLRSSTLGASRSNCRQTHLG
jgi:hypothetical protein